MAKWNYGLHMFVVFVSILEVALKVVIFFMLFRSQGKNAQSTRVNTNTYQQINSNGGANPRAAPEIELN